jgi:hypothetical protein
MSWGLVIFPSTVVIIDAVADLFIAQRYESFEH